MCYLLLILRRERDTVVSHSLLTMKTISAIGHNDRYCYEQVPLVVAAVAVIVALCRCVVAVVALYQNKREATIRLFIVCCCAQNQLVITIVKQLLLPIALLTTAVVETNEKLP